MKLGANEIRYGIVKSNGAMRLVIGAKAGSGSSVMYNLPVVKLGIKNIGSNESITVYSGNLDIKGSYIIKDEWKNVYTWGWIGDDDISVPSNTILWTHEQTPLTDVTGGPRLANIANGTFEIVEWSNCNQLMLVNGFTACKGLKKVPSQWPHGCFSVAYALKDSGITNVPSWSNLHGCWDITAVISGTEIDDLKLDTMQTSLGSVTVAMNVLNKVKVKSDMYLNEKSLYYVYDALKSHVSDENGANFFGEKNDGAPTDTIKYWYREADTGRSSWVVPSILIFIPTEWGGFNDAELTAVINGDSSEIEATPIKLHVESKVCTWDLSRYGEYYTVKGNRISSTAEYGDEFVRTLVECTNGTDTFYYDGFNSNGFVYWNEGKALMTPGYYTWTIHVFMPNTPDARIAPHFDTETGEIITEDYHEVMNSLGGRYTGTVVVPDVDVELSRVVVDEWDYEKSAITWNCRGVEEYPDGSKSDEKNVNEFVSYWTVTIDDYASFDCNPINLNGEVSLSLGEINDFLSAILGIDDFKLPDGEHTFTAYANRDGKQSTSATATFVITPEGGDEITWGIWPDHNYCGGIIVNFDTDTILNTIAAYQIDRGWSSSVIYVYKKVDGEWTQNTEVMLSHSMTRDNTPETMDGKASYLYTYTISGGYTLSANTDYMIVFDNVWWASNHEELVHTKGISPYNKGLCAINGNRLMYGTRPIIDETQNHIYG